jgi:hypothetical protein
MSAHAFHPGVHLPAVVRAPTRSPAALKRSALPRPAAAGWLERLAGWAERQPQHHRLGSYLVRA